MNFSLSSRSHVRLRIYDVAGRLVRVLVDETRPAGTYEAVWNGKNEKGFTAASGIYFCRMEAGDYERTLKMVLLR
jgi:flagellar hook assembly protein FlgD